MTMAKNFHCFLVSFALLYVVQGKNDVSFGRLLDTVEKIVFFYKQNHDRMNLDGIYGLRVLEGE